MLRYKAWLETRSRFLIGLAILIVFSSSYAYRQVYGAEGFGLDDYTILVAHGVLSFLWIVSATFLTMGGLLREQAIGSAPFTLSLPVSRRRLMGVGVLVRFGECVALGVIPWAILFAMAGDRGMAISSSQVFLNVALMFLGGFPFLAAALLLTSLLEGEYTAPAASLAVVCGDAILFNFDKKSPWYFLCDYNPWQVMMGSLYRNPDSLKLAGPIRWVHVAPSLLLAVVMTVIAFRAIQRRDF